MQDQGYISCNKQIAKAANTCGTVDDKTISEMKADHERVLKKVERRFDKFLKIM